ncbi:hypothetical protein ACLOJK_041643 [Asimina triloba]
MVGWGGGGLADLRPFNYDQHCQAIKQVQQIEKNQQMETRILPVPGRQDRAVAEGDRKRETAPGRRSPDAFHPSRISNQIFGNSRRRRLGSRPPFTKSPPVRYARLNFFRSGRYAACGPIHFFVRRGDAEQVFVAVVSRNCVTEAALEFLLEEVRRGCLRNELHRIVRYGWCYGSKLLVDFMLGHCSDNRRIVILIDDLKTDSQETKN